jgi:hypothetical protein
VAGALWEAGFPGGSTLRRMEVLTTPATPPGRLRRHSPGRAGLLQNFRSRGACGANRSAEPGSYRTSAAGAPAAPFARQSRAPTELPQPGRLRRHSPGRAGLLQNFRSRGACGAIRPAEPGSYRTPAAGAPAAPFARQSRAPTELPQPGRLRRHSPGRAGLLQNFRSRGACGAIRPAEPGSYRTSAAGAPAAPFARQSRAPTELPQPGRLRRHSPGRAGLLQNFRSRGACGAIRPAEPGSYRTPAVHLDLPHFGLQSTLIRV